MGVRILVGPGCKACHQMMVTYGVCDCVVFYVDGEEAPPPMNADDKTGQYEAQPDCTTCRGRGYTRHVCGCTRMSNAGHSRQRLLWAAIGAVAIELRDMGLKSAAELAFELRNRISPNHPGYDTTDERGGELRDYNIETRGEGDGETSGTDISGAGSAAAGEEGPAVDGPAPASGDDRTARTGEPSR